MARKNPIGAGFEDASNYGEQSGIGDVENAQNREDKTPQRTT